MIKIFILLVFLVASLAPSAGTAHEHVDTGMDIVHAWAPATTEPDAKSVTVYMTIRNRGGASDRLIRALANVADKIEIREPGDNAKLLDAVVIDAGKETELSSSGPHLILTGLRKPLHLHDRFRMALEFERVGRVVIDVIVGDPNMPEEHHHH